MALRIRRVGNLRAVWIIVTLAISGILLYWVFKTSPSSISSQPGNDLSHGHDAGDNSDVPPAVVKTSSQGLREHIDVIRTDQLPRQTHSDLFTEFDDVIMTSLYEEGEYAIDYRYDRAEELDVLESANATYSKMRVLNPKAYYEVNDIINVSIEVLNGYLKRILRGSDRVFIWIKEPSRGACASGYVLDHRNGTYTGVVRVLWPGSVDIMANIALSREGVRTMYKIRREGLQVRQIFAIFQRRFTYEMSLCAPTPYIPGHALVCNMTLRHFGLPWYCGHPDFLTCEEWTRVGASQPPWPLSDDEYELFDLSALKQNLPHPKNVKVTVSDVSMLSSWSGDMDRRDVIPCTELPPADTWKQSSPVGYFLHWRWRSTICRNTFPNTVRSWDKCLSNRRLWLHGDSTLRQWFVLLQRRQHLTLLTEKWRYPVWPLPSVQHSKTHNYVVFWGPHELPFTNSGEFLPLYSHKAVHGYIDELPTGTRDIVVLHLYLHFVAYTPVLLQTHIRRVVQSVEALLERAPEAKVFLKGPHAFHVNHFARGHVDDFWAVIYEQIYKKEFKRIEDKVYYLDFWDMTVASENIDVHPNSTLVEQMLQHMMGYICPE